MLFFVIGAVSAYYITTLQPLVTENPSTIQFFFAGALAICAMILPGISGAFILVLLGAYKPILEAIYSRDLKIIAIVGTGAVIGLLFFSRILKWLFNNYRDITLSVLTGFVFGSLNKIWPWKKVLESKIIREKLIVLKEESILPYNFEGESQLVFAIILAIS
jgi:putative membrane protein